MNPLARLFFLTFAVACIGTIFAGMNPELTRGQSLMLWSLLPVALSSLTAAFHSASHGNKTFLLVILFGGVFFAVISAGMQLQTGQVAYFGFVGAGTLLSLASTRFITTAFCRQRC